MKIKWVERYNCHRARVGRLGELGVSWPMERNAQGFDVSAFGTKLPEQVRDLDEAKAAAVRLAKELLAEAAKVLDEAE